jgi:hypothetical protein
VFDFTSPAKITWPVVTRVSHTTFELASNAKSYQLMRLRFDQQFCLDPSLTDSDVNKYAIINRFKI